MPVKPQPTFQTAEADIDSIVSFFDRRDPLVFYSRANVPVMLSVMSIHPDAPEQDAFTMLSPDALFNFSIRKSLSGWDKNSMHQHNYFEFMYILHGEMYQIVENRRYLYIPGSACLLNRNTLHNEVYTTDYTCAFLAISPELAASLLRVNMDCYFAREECFSRENMVMRFFRENLDDEHSPARGFLDFVPSISETEQREKMHRLFEDMANLLLSPGNGATFRLWELLIELFSLLCDPEMYRAAHVMAKTSADPLLFARIDQLLEKKHGRLSGAELSRLLRYNSSYIGRIVKKNTGLSLYNYAMTFTMREAANQLKQTDKSISEIAEELWFSNRTHFYQQFRQHYHMTPGAYRKSLHE